MTLKGQMIRTVLPCLFAVFQGISPAGTMDAYQVITTDTLTPPAVDVYGNQNMQVTYMDYRRRLEEARINGVVATADVMHVNARAPALSLG